MMCLMQGCSALRAELDCSRARSSGEEIQSRARFAPRVRLLACGGLDELSNVIGPVRARSCC